MVRSKLQKLQSGFSVNNRIKQRVTTERFFSEQQNEAGTTEQFFSEQQNGPSSLRFLVSGSCFRKKNSTTVSFQEKKTVHLLLEVLFAEEPLCSFEVRFQKRTIFSAKEAVFQPKDVSSLLFSEQQNKKKKRTTPSFWGSSRGVVR